MSCPLAQSRQLAGLKILEHLYTQYNLLIQYSLTVQHMLFTDTQSWLFTLAQMNTDSSMCVIFKELSELKEQNWWDLKIKQVYSKGIANGYQKDSRRTILPSAILLPSLSHLFAIRFVSVCYPFAIPFFRFFNSDWTTLDWFCACLNTQPERVFMYSLTYMAKHHWSLPDGIPVHLAVLNRNNELMKSKKIRA